MNFLFLEGLDDGATALFIIRFSHNFFERAGAAVVRRLRLWGQQFSLTERIILVIYIRTDMNQFISYRV